MLDRKRRAARQADAGMIARTHVFIDAEPFLHDAHAVALRLGDQRFDAALLVEHAFRGGDDHLGALLGRRQRFAQRVAHLGDIVGAVDLPHPIDADTLDRIGDGVVGRSARIVGARRQDVLSARGRGIVVIDDQDHAILLVEDGIADAAGQAVMPEPAIAHHRDRTLARGHVEGRGRSWTEPIPPSSLRRY